MRYWGIWVMSAEAWLRDTDGKIIYYPLESIAAAHLKQMLPSLFWEEEELDVKEFAPDGHTGE